MQCKQVHEYAHIKCNQSKIYELAPPICVLLFVQEFDPSYFLNVAPSLPIVHCPCPNPSFPKVFPKVFHIFVSLSPPLSPISIKGVPLLIQRVALGIDG